MNGNGQESERFDVRMQDMFGWATFVMRTWATSLEVFMHQNIGPRYLAGQALAVLLLIPLYAGFWRGYDLRYMYGYWLLYIPACMLSRRKSKVFAQFGRQCHSMYNGWPWLLQAKAKISELQMKQYYEPAMVFITGFSLYGYINDPLGMYLMIGSACLFLSVGMSVVTSRHQAMDLNDLAIEQELTAERLRGLRGDEE